VTARLDALRSWRRPENFHWLENSSVVIDGQRFIGCSLWFPLAPDADTGAISDFVQIRDFVPWVYERNRESVAFLEASVRFNDVVVTHHLPSSRCVDRKYRGDPLNAFFVCDVEHVIRAKKPAAWIHGHTHETVDLVVEQTRIVCNPYGYAGHETNGRFDPTKTIETPDWPELEAKPEGRGARNKRLPPGTIPTVSARPRYYLVVDLEATTSDDGSLPPEQMETIEIGAVLADARTLAVVDEFQSFVRPVRRPRLHPFVTKLTGITQSMVDGAPLFPEAFGALRARLIDHRHPLVFASWGRYDRIQLERDCGLHGIPNNMPAHVNLKTMFSEKHGLKKKQGMAGALKLCGLPLEGVHHRGIDDARNIARMLPWIVGDKALAPVRPQDDPKAKR
jgi:inhibitor of KinA sporulation pathway (predicted exonuclease)